MKKKKWQKKKIRKTGGVKKENLIYKRENHRIAKEKKIYITKDKNSEILQNTKDKIHELNTPDK